MGRLIDAFYDAHPAWPRPARSAVPDAWDSIVADAIAQLYDLGYMVEQYKEKWGELRIYTWPHADARAHAVIASAADAADQVCARCGAPATTTDRHWHTCAAHGTADRSP